jgi:hypothetical protein
MEENLGVAQKGEKRAARGVHEELPKNTWRDKEQTKRKKDKVRRQVMKKFSGWHRREKKERQEVHMRNRLRKCGETKSKQRRRKKKKKKRQKVHTGK